MKKLLVISFGVLMFFAPNHKIFPKNSLELQKLHSSEIEYNIGSRINIIDSANKVRLGIAYGSEHTKFGLELGLGKIYDEDLEDPGYAYIGSVKPYLLLEYPYYFQNKEYNEYFSVGPIFDFGATFSSVDSKLNISILEIGGGLKLEYFFSNGYGIGFVPCHFTINTALYKRGIGTQWKPGVSYDTYFSVMFVW